MNSKGLTFLYSPTKKALVAARSQTDPTILFRQENNDWVFCGRSYDQLTGDTIYDGGDFREITKEEAKNIYKDVCPDEKIFDEYDKFLENC
ncbi:MAG: hypothetical protein LBQ94_11940 [Treponema sp.]|jgi:hypothetical protein|nr:hypothetical protein [Treponema sp.]